MTAFVSHAANGEDVVLWRALGDRPDMRCVDAGGVGAPGAVTRSLRARGWSVVTIEPSAPRCTLLREERPGEPVVHGLTAATHGLQADSLVPMLTLDGVLAAFDEVHVLRICAAGAAGGDVAAALAGLDLSRRRPWVLLIAADPGAWQAGLAAGGYLPALFDGETFFFAARERAELLPGLCIPPHGRDGFIRAAEQAAIAARDAAEEALREGRREADALADRLAETLLAAHAARRDAATAHAALTRLQREHAIVTGQAAARTAELAALRSNLTWRLTSPLRAAAAWVDGLAHGGTLLLRLARGGPKPVIRAVARRVVQRPWLVALIRLVLRPFPRLATRVMRIGIGRRLPGTSVLLLDSRQTASDRALAATLGEAGGPLFLRLRAAIDRTTQ